MASNHITISSRFIYYGAHMPELAIDQKTLTLTPAFSIDLNADLGEGAGKDAELLRIVKMANISCGAHAGTENDIIEALKLAKEYGVRVGAHPGYPDLLSSKGRENLNVDPSRIYDWCHSQVCQLCKWASDVGVNVEWIKPHGAMYNQACDNFDYAMQIAQVAEHHQKALMGLPGSQLELAALALGIQFIKEGFADRAYLPNGRLVPRSAGDAAYIKDPAVAFDQIKRLSAEQKVTTICVHGDNAHALEFASRIREMMSV